jgi:NTP pyrophosphatase (non-canonical NTP hydrolase)
MPDSITIKSTNMKGRLVSFDDYAEDVIQWADDKGILHHSNIMKQFIKATEEMGEVASVIAKDSGKEAMTKEIGDVFVTMIILAKQNQLDYAECLRAAYDKISKRTGKMQGGFFVKSDDQLPKD